MANEPKFRVKFGSSVKEFYTLYHAEQFMRALDLNRTPYVMDEMKWMQTTVFYPSPLAVTP